MAKILVVDDHAANRELVIALIRHMAHIALQAVDGAEALAIVRRERPQLVISDILMPTMDGYEFVRQLRADPAISTTEVIFYTAFYHDREAHNLARACGVTRILTKPCEPVAIIQAIEQALGQAVEIAPPILPAEFDHEHLRLMTDKLSEKVQELQTINQRLGALTDLNLQLASERDPHTLLAKVCRGARDLIGARYALLAVGAKDEGTTIYAATSGMESAIAKSLGSPTMRAGQVGVAFEKRKACRLINPGGNPLNVGLPPQHPPVHSMLIAPVVSLAHAYGWICLTGKLGADEFSEDDEQVLTILAAQVGRIYENGSLNTVLQRAQTLARLAHVITGPAGEFLQWSESLPRMIGIDQTAIPDNTRKWLQLIHPADRERFRLTAIEAGRTGVRAEIDYRILRDGTPIYLRQILEPVIEDSTSAGGQRWFNTIQDVTEEHHATQKVLEAERQFRSIFENSVVGLFQTRLDGTVIGANPAAAQLLGYGSPDAFVAEVHDLGAQLYVDAADRDRFVRELQAGRVVHAFETRFRRKYGEIIWVSVSARLETDEVGAARYVLGSIQDITERKAQVEKISRLSRVYAVLSGINALIVRVVDRRELFDEACRIAIDDGNLFRAWIAYLDPVSKQWSLMASQGFDADIVARLSADLDDTMKGGRSLASRAVLERNPVLSTDVRNGSEKGMTALESRSMAALPLVINDVAVGVMLLQSDEPDFFDEEEMRLLSELAGHISFALDHLEKVERADYLVFYDQLTGLPNRRLFADRLGQMLGAVAADRPNVAVACIDVNRFAMINEYFGRDAGDSLLKALSARFTATFSTLGTVARIGGDGFAVAIPGKWDAAAIARGHEELYPALFQSPFTIAGQELHMAGAVGLAFSPMDGVGADALLGNAEAAVMRAKADGERILLYDSEMNARVGDTLAFEGKLRKAIAQHEFVLHYQPKVDLERRSIVGVEALLRWQSPELGLVPPLKFISLLEQSGMIIEVGAWALRRAALDHRAWIEAGLNAPRIAVNVSAIQLRHREFVNHVKKAMQEDSSPPGIDLEITESLVMDDVLGNIEKLKELRDLGATIAIDDFGTGYSSLAYLVKLPVDTLKIDRSFIITMLNEPATMTLVQTMISLAHSLGLKVVAEGVDEEEQAKILRLLRCDEMQGYLFSKPLPLDEMTALLRERDLVP